MREIHLDKPSEGTFEPVKEFLTTLISAPIKQQCARRDTIAIRFEQGGDMATTFTSAREPRTAISLRLPSTLLDTVERYATEHRLSKTDAFLHFLTKGIEAEESSSFSETLAQIEEKVTETLQLVRNQHGASSKNQVIEAVQSVCEEFPAIRRAFLFGSFARGTFGDESDIDLRLELGEKVHFNLRDLEHFSKRIEQATGRSVDVITARTIKSRELRDAFEREKELVYDREGK